MKKFLLLLFLFTIMFISSNKASAMSFEEGLKDSKPMALLIYASWADNVDKAEQTFNALEPKYNMKYNFIKLDIASPDTKAFNESFHIYPKLPYVLLFREKGKISRYLQTNCATDTACFSQKLDMFAN